MGDSALEQSATTLLAMIQAGRGGCAHQIVVCRTYFFTFGVKHTPKSWANFYHMYNPDIIIMNFGAHLTDHWDMHDTWSAFVGQRQEFVINQNKNVTFVWSTNNGGGHYDCRAPRYVLPLNETGISTYFASIV